MNARSIYDLPTPALLLDRGKVESNASRMLERARQLGVTLRPHVKTSKSIDVLRLLSGGGEVPITVSTLAEARYFFHHGIRDILYAVGIAPVKLPEVAALVRQGCTIRLILDTLEAAHAVREYSSAEGIAFEVLIEIDSDGHRAGVAAQDPLLLDIGRALGPSLGGVMTHAGASYDCRTQDEFEAMAERERSETVDAAERLRSVGLPCAIVSIGSTPSVHYSNSAEGVTEIRAGVYAFGDLVQAELGTCTPEDIAIGVLASVIGHNRHHGRVLIDAGFLALSRDRSTAALPVDWGYGAVCDPRTDKIMPDVVVSATNQEHGIITSRTGSLDFERFPVGSRLKILPNHACATAAAYDVYHVTDDGTAVFAEWKRINGW